MWLISEIENDFEVFVSEYNCFKKFSKGVPVSFKDAAVAIKYLKKYTGVKTCKDPQNYFTKENPFRAMIVRDAGIGDLLLLEPVIREYAKQSNKMVDVLTMYPEVYENHPYINTVYRAEKKEDQGRVAAKEYHDWVDLRSYSETCQTRAKEHRTDIYNEKFALDIIDKEPSLFFTKKEKSLLVKKKGFNYIGLSVEASHKFRGVDHVGLIDYLLSKDDKNIIVLFGVKKDEYKNSRVIDLRAKTSVRQAFNYIRGLDYMIAVDSGLMHVALSLHIKTVCIFTIITPDLRLRYYKGPHAVYTKKLDCIGCGNWHMDRCRTGRVECVEVEPNIIYDKMINLKTSKLKEPKGESKKVNIIPHSTKKLKIPFMTYNEEKNIGRFIDNVLTHPSIGECICIDGGSTDKTVKILEKAGVKVYKHPYLVDYHDAQAMQRNISCSYIQDGDHILIMDPDECFSPELSEYLPELAACTFEYGVISRRTFKLYKDINYPEKQIKDYPDFQPRFYIWNRKYKFVGSPHHHTLNVPAPVKIQKDILHFEEEGKDRKALEIKWAEMHKKTKAVYR